MVEYDLSIVVCISGGISQNLRRWACVSVVTNGFVGKESKRRSFRPKKGFKILKEN